jgi:hypothetical protein
MWTVLSGSVLSMQIAPVDVLAIRDMGEVRARIAPLGVILNAQDGLGDPSSRHATRADAAPADAIDSRDTEGPEMAS